MSRLGNGMDTIWRWVQSLPVPVGITAAAIVLLLFIIMIAAVSSPSVRSQIEELAVGGDDRAPNAATGRGEPGEGETAESGPLSGTWRVFTDESQSTPVLDLTFEPGGAAVLLMQSDIPSTIETWSYTENGDAVEVEMTYRITGKDGGVFRPHAWIRLTREGETMRGSYGGDDYIYEGRVKGMTVRGDKVLWDSVYARPE